jgi:hypothetical protein
VLTRALVVVLALAALVACDALWSAANRDALTADVGGLLRQHGAAGAAPQCGMIGATRDGTCRFQATPEQVAALAEGLGLRPTSPAEDGPDGAELRHWETRDGCRRSGAFAGPTATTHRSERRPPRLRLGHGGAFEYLLLYHQPATGEACVQVSYAYG